MSHSQEKLVSFSCFTKTTKKYIHCVIELSLVAIVLRLLGLVNPFIFQAIIDRILPFQRAESLYAIVVLMIAIMLFSTALSSLSGYLGAYLANRLTLEFGQRIYTHVLSLSLPTLRRWQVGELFTRIGEVDTIRVFFNWNHRNNCAECFVRHHLSRSTFFYQSAIHFHRSYFFTVTNDFFSIGRSLLAPPITPCFHSASCP